MDLAGFVKCYMQNVTIKTDALWWLSEQFGFKQAQSDRLRAICIPRLGNTS